MATKKEQRIYKLRCTDGSVKEYRYKEMFDLVKDYREQYGLSTKSADIDRAIPGFVSRMVKIVSDDYTREYDEAQAAARQAEMVEK